MHISRPHHTPAKQLAHGRPGTLSQAGLNSAHRTSCGYVRLARRLLLGPRSLGPALPAARVRACESLARLAPDLQGSLGLGNNELRARNLGSGRLRHIAWVPKGTCSDACSITMEWDRPALDPQGCATCGAAGVPYSSSSPPPRPNKNELYVKLSSTQCVHPFLLLRGAPFAALPCKHACPWTPRPCHDPIAFCSDPRLPPAPSRPGSLNPCGLRVRGVSFARCACGCMSSCIGCHPAMPPMRVPPSRRLRAAFP